MRIGDRHFSSSGTIDLGRDRGRGRGLSRGDDSGDKPVSISTLASRLNVKTDALQRLVESGALAASGRDSRGNLLFRPGSARSQLERRDASNAIVLGANAPATLSRRQLTRGIAR